MPTGMRMGCTTAAMRKIKELYHLPFARNESNVRETGINLHIVCQQSNCDRQL